MFDTHSHIIYGVDDGSKTLETSKELLYQAAACGTTGLFATPHVLELHTKPSWTLIKERVAELQKLVPEDSLLKLYTGAEVEMSWDILKAYDEEPGAYCINGGRYALIELPMLEVPIRADDFWFELQLKGITPILAHPERYPALWTNPDKLLTWLKKGLLLQINGGSLLGHFGKAAQKNAEILLKNHLVSFIGSDAHSPQRRNTNLTPARIRLKELISPEEYNSINVLNPQHIINNEDININVPSKLVVEKDKKSFWSKIFG